MFAIPNKLSAVKRVRQNEKRRLRNLRRKRRVRRVIKQVQQQLEAGRREQAQELVPQLMKAVDKAAQHGAIPPNKAARLKARLMKRVNAQS